MSLLFSFIFCAIYCLSVHIENGFADYLFGCEVVPHINDIPTLTPVKEQSIPFGLEIQPAEFTNETELEENLQKIDNVLSKVVVTNVWNTVEDFMRYFHSFRQNKYKKMKNIPKGRRYALFEEHFDKYIPQFKEDDGTLGLLYQVLKEIVTTYPEFEKNVYIAAVYVGASDELVRRQEFLRDLDESRFVINYVVGIFQYRFNNFTYYAILDPANRFIKAVRLSEGDIAMDENNEILGTKFRMLPHIFGVYEDGSVVFYNVPYMIQSVTKVDGADVNSLIYVKKPLCAAMKTFAKRDLLNPRRLVEMRDEEGKLALKIFVDILPPKKKEDISFNIQIRNRTETIKYSSFKDRPGRTAFKAMLREAIPDITDERLHFFDSVVKEFVVPARDPDFVALYATLILEETGNTYGSVTDETTP